MFVRKNKIAQLLKKEKQKERRLCQKENDQRFNETIKMLKQQHDSEMRELKQSLTQQLKGQERENKRLKEEIDRNYATYQLIRKREAELYQLSAEIETVVDTMVIKVQESLQPFYRTRAKIESVKRRSGNRHEKVESIFRSAK